MSRRRVISVGNRRDYPRDLWGPRDFEWEQEENDRIRQPLRHAPGGAPSELKFSLFETPVLGGARSRAVDKLIKQYVGR